MSTKNQRNSGYRAPEEQWVKKDKKNRRPEEHWVQRTRTTEDQRTRGPEEQ